MRPTLGAHCETRNGEDESALRAAIVTRSRSPVLTCCAAEFGDTDGCPVCRATVSGLTRQSHRNTTALRNRARPATELRTSGAPITGPLVTLISRGRLTPRDSGQIAQPRRRHV